MKKRSISLMLALRIGIWLLVRRMRKEVDKTKNDPDRHRAYQEISNAILIICENVAKLFDINIKIGYIDPRVEVSKKEKKIEKVRKRTMRRSRKKIRNYLIVALTMFAMCSFATEPMDAPAPLAPQVIQTEDISWEVFSHFAIGAAWDLGTGEEHGIAFVSVLTYKKLLNFDIGLIDFEQVQDSGDQWYENINPGLGISADLLGLMERLPTIGEFIGFVPDIVGLGIGVYFEIDSKDIDVIPMIYLTARW